MDESLESVAHAHEGTEVHQLRNGSLNEIANLDVGDCGVPWVWLQLADREANAPALRVDVDDFGVNRVANVVAGLWVGNLRPADLTLVNQAVNAAKVNEESEWRDRAHHTGNALANRKGAEEFVALTAALLIVRNLLGEDQAVPLAVHLQDLHAQLAANVRLQLLGNLLDGVTRCVASWAAREVNDLADRHEAANATVNNESALVVIDNGGLDDGACVELLLHRAPLALHAGAADREHNVPIFRLWLHDVDEYGVADGEGWALFAVAAVKFAARDNTFALRADVNEHFVLVDAHNDAVEDIALLQILNWHPCAGEQLFHGGWLRAGPHTWRWRSGGRGNGSLGGYWGRLGRCGIDVVNRRGLHRICCAHLDALRLCRGFRLANWSNCSSIGTRLDIGGARGKFFVQVCSSPYDVFALRR